MADSLVAVGTVQMLLAALPDVAAMASGSAGLEVQHTLVVSHFGAAEHAGDVGRRQT